MLKSSNQSQSRSDGIRFVRNLLIYLVMLAGICFGLQQVVMSQVKYHLGVASWMTFQKRDWVREGWVKFPEGKVGVVALGDSRMLAALSAVEFDAAQDNKTYTFNLSLPASTSGTHLAVMRDLIASGSRPDWLILALSPMTPARSDITAYRSIGVTNPGEMVDVLQSHPYWRKVLMDWILPMRRFQHEFVLWLNRLFFKPNELEGRRAASSEISKKLDATRGAFVNPGDLKPSDADAVPNYLNLDSNEDPACRKLMEFAVKHNIKVLLISAPIRPGEIVRTPETKEESESVAVGMDGVFVSRHFFDPIVLPVDEFSDLVHTNERGAAEFSRILAREFTSLRSGQSNDSIPSQ